MGIWVVCISHPHSLYHPLSSENTSPTHLSNVLIRSINFKIKLVKHKKKKIVRNVFTPHKFYKVFIHLYLIAIKF